MNLADITHAAERVITDVSTGLSNAARRAASGLASGMRAQPHAWFVVVGPHPAYTRVSAHGVPSLRGRLNLPSSSPAPPSTLDSPQPRTLNH
jgi:hypothetical protein